MPKKKTTEPVNNNESESTFVVGSDFSPSDAWEQEYYYTMIRKFGAQSEADRRLGDPKLKAMIEWALANPQISPLVKKTEPIITKPKRGKGKMK